MIYYSSIFGLDSCFKELTYIRSLLTFVCNYRTTCTCVCRGTATGTYVPHNVADQFYLLPSTIAKRAPEGAGRCSRAACQALPPEAQLAARPAARQVVAEAAHQCSRVA